ncbi:MAG TPA: DUF1579 domain-containing protein [Anaerolineales bacterium]|nr:DUF1579 domain-containing protein [Anaerolineales bacterium]
MTFPAFHPANSPHHFLAQLAGSWSGTTRTWLDPDSEPSESQTQGSFQVILDGRFVIYLYESSVDGEPQHGMFTFGFNTGTNQYEASWLDSYHNNTAIMHCVGRPLDHGFSVLGSYPDPQGNGPEWGWRTELELVDADSLNLTGYMVNPEGGEAVAVKTVLARVRSAS